MGKKKHADVSSLVNIVISSGTVSEGNSEAITIIIMIIFNNTH